MPTAPGQTTMADLARQAGVSTMTVSRAIRGSGRIDPKTRSRIMKLATAAGYRPNTAATAMLTGRFNCVSLLLSTNLRRSTMSSELLRGIQEQLLQCDMHLNVSMLPDESLIAQWGMPSALRRNLSDGLLINYTHAIPAQLVELIRSNHTPSVWINSKQQADCVYPDDVAGAVQMTEYLAGMGHRAIAYVDLSHKPDSPRHYSAVDRRAGYVHAMQTAGLTPRFIELSDEKTPDDRMRMLMARLPDLRPTAVIAYSGSNIIQIHTAALRLGWSVPRDLSLATFDASATDVIGQVVTTGITPEYEVGRIATRMLCQRVEGTEELPPVAVPFQMSPGETCTAPPV